MNLVTVSQDTADRTIYAPQGAGATYECELSAALYRYRLWRIWDWDRPLALFIMLNPSTATHLKLDPTLKRCKAFAIDWKMGGFEVVNLFAWRATKPAKMKRAGELAIGAGNDDLILGRALAVSLTNGIIVCGWGTHGSFMNRGADVRDRLRRENIKLHVLRLTRAGDPGHPLYLPKETKPVEWL